MEAQEIFDTVAKHLATQGRRAVGEGRCLYRTEDGAKCAVGCLISDEEYTPDMELRWASGVLSLAERGLLPTRLAPHTGLLSALQGAHDDAVTSLPIKSRLANIASANELSPAILDTLSFPERWK